MTNGKKKLLTTALMAMLAPLLVMSLASCSCARSGTARKSGGATALVNDVSAEEVAGHYEIAAMVTEGKETAPEDLALLKDKGLVCTITLESDGTGVLNLFGEETSLTWDASGISTGKKKMTYTYQDGQLTVVDDESTLTFSKTE